MRFRINFQKNEINVTFTVPFLRKGSLLVDFSNEEFKTIEKNGEYYFLVTYPKNRKGVFGVTSSKSLTKDEIGGIVGKLLDQKIVFEFQEMA